MLVFTSPACELHVNDNASVESPRRYPAMLAGLERAEGSGLPVERRTPPDAPRGALLAVHSPEYLDTLRESESRVVSLDPDTAAGAGSWGAALAASGAAVSAVEAALGGEVSFAVSRPPGHHSGGDYAMGFCLTNHAAVAAARALALGAGRVAILDWDVHHGNGTQDIFYESGEVLYLSVHRGGMFYPGTGGAGEVGSGPGEGFSVNVPLPVGSGAAEYRAAFSGVLLPALREFSPGAVVVSAGYDAHRDDPIGGMRLVSEDFALFAATLVRTARETGFPPPAFVLEGGYDLSALASGIAATIEGAISGSGSGGPGLTEDPGPLPDPVEVARETLAPYWKSLRPRGA